MLAGSSPVTAVRCQIVVMFMLASSVAATATLVALWYRRTFFAEMEEPRSE
jgi:ABC-type iron transport system FetAB permease component